MFAIENSPFGLDDTEEQDMAPTFEVYEDHGWRWKLIDGNGETIATSEPYASESNAELSAKNVQATAPVATITKQ